MNFRKMTSNKHFGLRKIEKNVRSNYYPENTSKVKGKKSNLRKSCKNFKIVYQHLTSKRKKGWLLENDRELLIPQYRNPIFI